MAPSIIGLRLPLANVGSSLLRTPGARYCAGGKEQEGVAMDIARAVSVLDESAEDGSHSLVVEVEAGKAERAKVPLAVATELVSRFQQAAIDRAQTQAWALEHSALAAASSASATALASLSAARVNSIR